MNANKKDLINIGSKIRVEFEVEVEAISKNGFQDGSFNYQGWIHSSKGNCLALVTVPLECVKEVLS